MLSSARFTLIVPGFSILKDLPPVSPEPVTVTAPLASVTTHALPVHLYPAAGVIVTVVPKGTL